MKSVYKAWRQTEQVDTVRSEAIAPAVDCAKLQLKDGQNVDVVDSWECTYLSTLADPKFNTL